MGRFPNVATRIAVAGAVALVLGSVMVVGVTVQQALTGAAFADSSPYEMFCPSTPEGNVVLNDVVLTGALSPASPTVGQTFNLTGFQTQEQLPAEIVQDAADTGLTSLTGTLTTTIDATGATPASISTGSVSFDIPIPDPIPSSGLAVTIPSVTVGPFTATSDNIALSSAPVSQTMDIDGDGIGLISLHCSSYPNDTLPGGFTNDTPPGVPISPVIATAGQVTPPSPSQITGPYELYCPHTPVGDLVFNDVTTSATISPSTLSAGDQFQVTGYQTVIPIPSGAVTAAVGLGNGGFDGLATSYVDAYGTTSTQAATGSMGFDVPIPNPVPSTGLALAIPSSPTTVGPFTASGGPVTIAQDQSILVVAELSDKAFKMSCTAYPNDSIATSGTTGTPPAATPIRPIIATADASGTPLTTTTTLQPGGTGPGSQTPGAPYELYCPSTPVGDIAVNDVVTTGSITPSSLDEGDTFEVGNLQTQFSIPQSVAQQLENLGLSTLSGDLSLFLDVSGTETGYGLGQVVNPTSTPTTVIAPGGVDPGGPPIPIPYPGPYPGEDDMSFSVNLPSPVPSTGVQFTATPAAGSAEEGFVAAGGPIEVSISGANLDVSAFGDQFGLFCETYANDTVPTGLSINQPDSGFTEPLVTTGSATVVPPPPTPPGTQGAYELYCPGTPVGNIALNNVETVGTITPPDPTAGQQFNVTGYQSTITLPSSIVAAASALGNTAITGNATASLDASGATPAQISTGAMSFDVAIPSPLPATGTAFTVPSPPGTIGPFTASDTGITIAEDASVQLDLVVSGSSLELRCAAYRNNTEPTGIIPSAPSGSPMSPVIAVAGGGSPGTTSTTSLTVSPSSDVTNGERVTVTGSGLTPSSAGNILECNDAANQPVVSLGSPINHAVAVGCSPPSLSQVVATSSSGTLSSSYTVVQGTVGPPCGSAPAAVACPPADSSGQSPETDAADYPCPPTPAQDAAGVTCTLEYGDAAGDAATAPILFSGSQPPTPTTTPGTTPTTTPPGASAATAEITQAYQTLFDFADPSVADKVAVVQNGASIETALSQALSSSLASSAAGANIDAVSFLDASACTQVNLPSPCAQVTYDILGPDGTAILPNNQGYAVSINGTWLVATNTICELLGLFYQAAGMTGTPPGCSGLSTPSTTTTVTGTVVGAGQDPSSTSPPTTAGSDPATSSPPGNSAPTTAPATKAASATDPSGSGSTTASSSSVQAPSSSLAFTGAGSGIETATMVGVALMVLGILMLALADIPRRAVRRLASLNHGRYRDRGAGSTTQLVAPTPATSDGPRPAAWYGDPLAIGLRYWNGTSWTEHVAYQDHASAWSLPPCGERDDPLNHPNQVDGSGPEVHPERPEGST
jgi:hypothetical protein